MKIIYKQDIKVKDTQTIFTEIPNEEIFLKTLSL